MEEKINVVEILKDKPVNTKLWSPLFGDVYTSSICSEDTIIIVNHHAKSSSFYNNGKYFNHAEAEPLLFPSKEMRDWSKFAWKKGDILVSNDSDSHIIFNGFSKNDYTTFEGKHWISVSKKRHVSCLNMQNVQDYHIEDNKEFAQTYINTIEERLEIEKQPEFKDGDIVLYGKSVAICRRIYKHTLYFYVSIDETFGLLFNDNRVSAEGYRFATDSEKQLLFEALAKEGKAWDAEKKQIVNLKPKKCEFKPFDKVLCRNSKDDTWEADFFARLTRKEIDYIQSGKYLCVGDLWMHCIPYNEQTAHLLGTTDEWKGGEV
jgi:hypothetical protein